MKITTMDVRQKKADYTVYNSPNSVNIKHPPFYGPKLCVISPERSPSRSQACFTIPMADSEGWVLEPLGPWTISLRSWFLTCQHLFNTQHITNGWNSEIPSTYLVGGFSPYPSEKSWTSSVGMIFPFPIYIYIETYKNPWFQSPPLAAMTAPWPQLGPGEPGFKDRLAEAPPWDWSLHGDLVMMNRWLIRDCIMIIPWLYHDYIMIISW